MVDSIIWRQPIIPGVRDSRIKRIWKRLAKRGGRTMANVVILYKKGTNFWEDILAWNCWIYCDG